jgi:hypothetical protein
MARICISSCFNRLVFGAQFEFHGDLSLNCGGWFQILETTFQITATKFEF